MYWMGEEGCQDIETLPREKLLEIIQHLSRDLQSARGSHFKTLELFRLAQKRRHEIEGIWS